MQTKRPLSYAASALVLAGSLFALAGCGSSSPDPGAGAGGVSASSTGSVKRVAVTVTGSTVTPAPAQLELPVGGTLELVVTSDHDDEIHAHGFDQEAKLKAGAPTTLRLTTTQPGVYEVETHDPALTLLTVAVR